MSLIDDVLAGLAAHTDNIKTQTHENGPIPHNFLISVVNHCHLVAFHLDSSKEAPIKLGKVLQSQKPPISTARFTLETYPRQDPGLATDTVTAVQLHAILQHGDRIHGQMFDHPVVKAQYEGQLQFSTLSVLEPILAASTSQQRPGNCTDCSTLAPLPTPTASQRHDGTR